MQPLLTIAETRAHEADASARLGVASILLMENAGRGAFDALMTASEGDPGHVVIVGGAGQNGGDGWVLARLLHGAGVSVTCHLVGDAAKVRGDAAPNLRTLDALGLTPDPVDGEAGLARLEQSLAHADILVDALFGIGLARPIVDLHAEVVARMNAAEVWTCSLDLPSGVHADDGRALGERIIADATVTFGALKRGLFAGAGPVAAGEVVVADIGVPAPVEANAWLLEADDLRELLPPRAHDAHKGTAGHVLVVGGAEGMSGAAILAARGALRGGGGLATVVADVDSLPAVRSVLPECMTIAWEGALAEQVAHAMPGCDVLVLGPGLGRDAVMQDVVRDILREVPAPVVVDADALFHLAELGLGTLREVDAPCILTPHPKEAARLLGVATTEVQADRFAAVRQMAEESGQVCVLKGAGTLIAAPSGQVWACDRGSPALGTGGSGDVLAGVIAAALVSLPPMEAAGAGVLLHAIAGERVSVADRGVLAREIADALPEAWAFAVAEDDG